jgi:hypothetical protein
MPGTYTVSERWSARKRGGGSNKGATVEYIITETTVGTLSADDGEVIDVLADTVPTEWGEALIPRVSYDVEQIADRIWVGTVNYGYNKKDVGDIEYNFDTGGGSQKITQTISPLSVTKYGTNAPDFKGAINVDSNSVNGVDIIVPVYSFSETRIVDNDDVGASLKSALFNLTGKTNNAAWHGFAAGEVLFMGASGSRHGRRGDWEINFKFGASPNKTNITIGTISGISKKGWEYLWVLYEKSTDQNCLIQVPKAVYVHQVYASGDFSALGLGA